MLPLIPILAIASSAAVLIGRKLKAKGRKANLERLIMFAKRWYVPVDDDGNFDPDVILPDGLPILFHFISNSELLVAILEYGANPNICDTSGTPAIVYAAKQNCDGAVATLLKYGVNPNAMDSEGKSAIFHTESQKILQMLKNSGADMNAVDIHGKTALYNEVGERKSIKAVSTLIRLGADVNAKDNDGKSVLFYTDDLNAIAFLVAQGADIEATDNNGEKCKSYQSYIKFQNALHNPTSAKDLRSAVEHDDINAARMYLINGANPNIWHTTIKNWTMIHLALYNKNPQMIELLVKFGADVNASRNGIPPLSNAVYDGNLECFKLLLELGADTNRSRDAIKYSGTPEMQQLAKQYYKI